MSNQTDTLDEILKRLVDEAEIVRYRIDRNEIKPAEGYNQITSLKEKAKQAILAYTEREVVEAVISTYENLNFSRMYGLDYQETHEKLDEIVKNKAVELKERLKKHGFKERSSNNENGI